MDTRLKISKAVLVAALIVAGFCTFSGCVFMVGDPAPDITAAQKAQYNQRAYTIFVCFLGSWLLAVAAGAWFSGERAQWMTKTYLALGTLTPHDNTASPFLHLQADEADKETR